MTVVKIVFATESMVGNAIVVLQHGTLMRNGIGGHTRPVKGETDVWLTPPEIIRALGPFVLDPCSLDPRPWDTAFEHYTKEQNGLLLPWQGRVWMNPPYSDAAVWLERLALHGEGTALVFARTETEMFRKWVWPYASGLLFLFGRLHFHRADGSRAKGNAGGPSVLVAYGSRDSEALRGCGLEGAFIGLRKD